MSKKTALALAAAIALALPATVFGQGIGIGARIGTLGAGGEVSVGFGSRLAVRGGFGVFPVDPKGTFSDIEYELNPPSNIWNVGVDLYPFGGGFRISAGMLNRKAYGLHGTTTQTTTIGGQQYSGDIVVNGTLTNEKETAPYASIGFGRTYSKGIGLFLDLGAAQMGEADITLTGTCKLSGTQTDCTSQSQFNSDLQAEADNAEADVGTYLKWHPVLQIGLKIGIGK
jgi:hypothetical protein